MGSARRHPEHALQRAVVQYLRTIERTNLLLWWTAVNALPGTSPRQGAQAKSLGQRAGSPDIIGCVAGKFFGFELKAPKGALSHAQDICEGGITVAGGHWVVVRSVDDAASAIAALMPVRNPTRRPVATSLLE